LPRTIRPFKKTKKKSIKKQRKKGKQGGFSQLFFFTKLTIQSQKKINFLMHLYRKHCKEGATIVTQFWPIGF
jgi:hypothetical protein